MKPSTLPVTRDREYRVVVTRWDPIEGLSVAQGAPAVHIWPDTVEDITADEARALAKLLEAAADLIDPR